jgi:hypothetical protein
MDLFYPSNALHRELDGHISREQPGQAAQPMLDEMVCFVSELSSRPIAGFASSLEQDKK